METRTIALQDDGDLEIGGDLQLGPVVTAAVLVGDGYGFTLDHEAAGELACALEDRAPRTRIVTHGGHVIVTVTNSLACLWFYAQGEVTPERSCRLFEGAIDAAAEAFDEAAAEAESTAGHQAAA